MKKGFYKVKLLMAAVAFIMLSGSASAASQTGFRDIKSSDYYSDAIQSLTGRGILKGYEDNTYKPNQPVTRAQAAKILAMSLNIETKKAVDPGFSDVKEGHWSYGPVAVLVQAGILKGYDDKTFKPNERLTRAQMAKILTLGYNFNQSYNPNHSFMDVTEKSWFSSFVSPLIERGVTTGRTAVNFAPNDFVTRGQMAAFIYRSEQSFKNKDDDKAANEPNPEAGPNPAPETPQETGIKKPEISNPALRLSHTSDTPKVSLQGNVYKIDFSSINNQDKVSVTSLTMEVQEKGVSPDVITLSVSGFPFSKEVEFEKEEEKITVDTQQLFGGMTLGQMKKLIGSNITLLVTLKNAAGESDYTIFLQI